MGVILRMSEIPKDSLVISHARPVPAYLPLVPEPQPEYNTAQRSEASSYRVARSLAVGNNNRCCSECHVSVHESSMQWWQR